MKGGVIFKKVPTTYEYVESRFKQLLEYLRLNYWYVVILTIYSSQSIQIKLYPPESAGLFAEEEGFEGVEGVERLEGGEGVDVEREDFVADLR